MNFLAHAYLSGNNDDIRFGNMIGDFIKGNRHEKFSSDVQKGILMHRDIDSFTDSHPIIAETRKLFYEKYHKYAGIILDIIWDHFLASNWEKHSEKSLYAFSRHTYLVLVKNYSLIPSRVILFLSYMIVNDWLTSYKDIEFIKRTFNRMPYRTSLPPEGKFAIRVLKNNYEYLGEQFDILIKDLKEYIGNKYDISYYCKSL
ncbi:MAG: acyl carrier protein phosphodiesterase [Marinilabiliales bacterium]